MHLLERRDVLAEQPDEQGEHHLDHVVDRGEGADRRLAGRALAHLHRHLDHPQLVLEHHQRGLDLRVVVRVVGGEEGDRLWFSAWKPEVGSVTRRPTKTDSVFARIVIAARRVTELWYPPSPAKREPTTMSASPASTGRGGAELGGVVLAVPVDPHRELEAVLVRVAEAGLDCAADPEVERQADDVRTARAAAAVVPSAEPSSTTTMSKLGSNARISSITRGTLSSSLYAGTIAMAVSARHSPPANARHAQQVEQPPCAMEVRVLVEPRSRAARPISSARPGSSSSSW